MKIQTGSNPHKEAMLLLITSEAMNAVEFSYSQEYLLEYADLLKNLIEKQTLSAQILRSRTHKELFAVIEILNQHQIYPIKALYSDQAIGKQLEVTATTR